MYTLTIQSNEEPQEVVEKLVILHVRMWMLEDAMAEAKTDSELNFRF